LIPPISVSTNNQVGCSSDRWTLFAAFIYPIAALRSIQGDYSHKSSIGTKIYIYLDWFILLRGVWTQICWKAKDRATRNRRRE
jgi:hypothetical protein